MKKQTSRNALPSDSSQAPNVAQRGEVHGGATRPADGLPQLHHRAAARADVGDLDVDALRVVSEGVNRLKNKDNAIVLVTHYQRILSYIVPDFVHVLSGGKIIKSGGKDLALEVERRGYDWLVSAAAGA